MFYYMIGIFVIGEMIKNNKIFIEIYKRELVSF